MPFGKALEHLYEKGAFLLLGFPWCVIPRFFHPKNYVGNHDSSRGVICFLSSSKKRLEWWKLGPISDEVRGSCLYHQANLGDAPLQWFLWMRLWWLSAGNQSICTLMLHIHTVFSQTRFSIFYFNYLAVKQFLVGGWAYFDLLQQGIL